MATPIFNITDIDLYNILMGYISTNITDVRTDRTNNRWVFDSYPTTDSNYPEIIVDEGTSTKLNDLPANLLSIHSVDATEDSPQKQVYAYSSREEFNVKIRVLTLKDSSYNITEGVSIMHLKDKTLNLYLLNKLKNIFTFDYLSLINSAVYNGIRIIEQVRVLSVDRVYEANSRVWASDITVKLIVNNLNIKEYSGEELINDYTLILNLN